MSYQIIWKPSYTNFMNITHLVLLLRYIIVLDALDE